MIVLLIALLVGGLLLEENTSTLSLNNAVTDTTGSSCFNVTLFDIFGEDQSVMYKTNTN